MPSVLRAWRLRATIVLAFAVLAGCASHPTRAVSGRTATASSPSRTVSATTTTAHVFAAFDSGGAPAAGVTAHRPGTCFASSITVSARGAYRCMAGNVLLDPCFAATRHTVFCFADPWSKAVELRLTKALPAPGAPLKIAQPWALELTGGVRCVVSGGTTPLVHGVAMRYRCDGAAAGLLPSTSQALRVLLKSSDGTLQRVAVNATWTA